MKKDECVKLKLLLLFWALGTREKIVNNDYWLPWKVLHFKIEMRISPGRPFSPLSKKGRLERALQATAAWVELLRAPLCAPQAWHQASFHWAKKGSFCCWLFSPFFLFLPSVISHGCLGNQCVSFQHRLLGPRKEVLQHWPAIFIELLHNTVY